MTFSDPPPIPNPLQNAQSITSFRLTVSDPLSAPELKNGFTLTCASSCFAHCLPSLSARCGLSFSFSSCLHVACDATANFTLKNGGFYLPFLASNCAIRCHDLLHMSNLHGSSLFRGVFYHHLTYGGCVLQLANLIAKNGSWNLPSSASNCDFRCYIWFYFCLACGLSLVAMGF